MKNPLFNLRALAVGGTLTAVTLGGAAVAYACDSPATTGAGAPTGVATTATSSATPAPSTTEPVSTSATATPTTDPSVLPIVVKKGWTQGKHEGWSKKGRHLGVIKTALADDHQHRKHAHTEKSERPEKAEHAGAHHAGEHGEHHEHHAEHDSSDD